MANRCEYDISVRGSKLVAYFIYASMPAYNEKEIYYAEGTDDNFEIRFSGDCKHSIDAYCSNIWDKGDIDLNSLNLIDPNGLVNEDNGCDYWGYTLEIKSEVFNCYIAAQYRNEEEKKYTLESYNEGERDKAILGDKKIPWEKYNKEHSYISNESIADDHQYTVVSGKLVSYSGPGGDVVLPSNVMAIAKKAFRRNKEITSIYIPSNVKEIEESSFESCKNLKRVVIEEGISIIRENTFAYCKNIEEVLLPESIECIESWAFMNCEKLDVNKVYLSNRIVQLEPGAFHGCLNDSHIYFSDDSTVLLKYGPFLLSEAEKTYKIPNTVKRIEDFAFSSAQYIEEIEIPTSVTVIGQSSFSWCKNLKRIMLHEGITKMGPRLFWMCEQLEEITIPKGVTKIESSTFSECKSLINCVIPEGITSIDKGAFHNCTSLKEMIIPSSVTELGEGVFTRCENLKEIIIPGSIKEIPKETFKGCSSLKKVVFEDGVEIVKSGAFNGCGALEEVYVYGELSKKLPAKIFKDAKDVMLYGIPGGKLEVFANEQSLKFVDINTVDK